MLDLLIVGGSSAGTPAAIYAARRGLNFKMVTKDFSGELATSGEIGNWPGTPLTNGIDLARQFRDHLSFLKVPIDEGVEVEKIMRRDDGTFCVSVKSDGETPMAGAKLEDGHSAPLKCDYEAKTVILATGSHPRELAVAGEKEYRNKGVSYCTTCDGPLFAGRTVATIGGGNSALESALMLADICAKVYVLNKNPMFKGEQVLLKNLEAKKNATIIYNARTLAVKGGEFVTALEYVDASGAAHSISVDGIFVHIGMVANSYMAPEGTAKNQFGEIIVNRNGETNVAGLYAAGDITDMPFKQNPIAAGHGTTALLAAVSYLNRLS